MNGLAALSAVGFALICVFAGRLGIGSRLRQPAGLSFAGGAATAYVFVHLLPEIGYHRLRIEDSAHAAYVVFLYPVLLAGTCIYYGLESYLSHSKRMRGTAGFAVHMAGFSLYFALIGYFLQHRGDKDPIQELFYFLVLGLHILVLDTEFRRRHEALYDRIGRWVMAGCVLAGWALGALVRFPAIVSGMAFALLAGGMILNILKQELPASREGQVLPFLLGAGICAGLLTLA
jgi:hypothetical protein